MPATPTMIEPIELTDLTSPANKADMIGDGSELTPLEVAREFRVSPATVRRWEAAGILKPSRRLPGSKHRRYSRAAVDALKTALEQDEETGGQGS